MLEMKITVTAPDVVAALNNLANAIANGTAAPVVNNATVNTGKPATPVENVAPATAPTGVPAVNPTQAPGAPLSATPAQTAAQAAPTVPVAQPAPVANTAPAPTVPTSAPQYTLDMIATAGSALIDAGKMDQLMQLLGKFGVASLTELTPESYGAVAGELRALGATI